MTVRTYATSDVGRCNAGLGMDAEPFEVTYTTTGKKRRQTRNVAGVLCPTALALRMGLARPIFVDLGDVLVDWTAPQTAGYAAMFYDTPNVGVEPPYTVRLNVGLERSRATLGERDV